MTQPKLNPVSLRSVEQTAALGDAPTDALECGPVWLSPHEMCELRVRGNRVQMSESQLVILAALIRAQGRILTRDELSGGPGSRTNASTRAIDIQVSRIRIALGQLGRHVIAVRGRGYRIDVRGLASAR